ncbi:putative reverse transcriptase domain-containing protein, partial [Tanacetum coccineum]
VKIDDIRTRKRWNFPSCGGEKCEKGVVRKEGSFWCQACDKAIEYPALRFRLELDVSDKTASTVVVMFDEPATELLKCSADSLAAADEDVGLAYADDVGLPRPLANIIGITKTLEIKSHTYYEHGTFECFTCWRIASEEVVEEDTGSSNVNTTPDINIKQTKWLTTKSTVATPSKPREGRGKKVQSNSTLHRYTNFEFTTSMPPMVSALTCIFSLFLGWIWKTQTRKIHVAWMMDRQMAKTALSQTKGRKTCTLWTILPLVVMSSASSAVIYTSVYIDSEPGRVFWGADEEISDRGSPRVIVLGYDGLPIQPVAPPSLDYIPDFEEPQTPLVPQDEDEREPMFIQPHDPNYAPEPIYPEYIPLEDEHEFPAEEQPLPSVVSPTAESPGYVVESDPEEDDDDDNSSGDDADDDDKDKEDEDEEEDEEEEEEHLALADSAVVIPTASISLPLEAEVKRLLAMPTPPPSPPILLSPPSVGERLTRCTTPSAHSSPPPVPSPLLPSFGCPTQIQTLRIASTQALIDVVTVALPSPPLPPLPLSLYIPPHVDRRNDIPKFEWPPRKRSCLFALGSKYKVWESSTTRPTRGRMVDYGFFSTLDAEERQRGIREVGYGFRDTWVDPAEAVPEIAPMTVGEVNTKVTELAELHEHDTQDLYALLEDAQDRDGTHCGGGGLCFPRGLGLCDRIEHQAQIVETLRVMRERRQEMGDMQAELLALREQQRRARQPAPDTRVLDHQDASSDADSHI